ncbi:hypothetical protein RHMOL_Rhmol01G0118200 [Rhododendron molle]|uniref:Uncharacterized protein n=1 Tax=Rhododendron molle TaxID=49168 RepID=A0ACC0Q1W1_RHOML|nr:hypothetical protein RHMOL_Rhmol01G0118200 [Rhododendron molle]
MKRKLNLLFRKRLVMTRFNISFIWGNRFALKCMESCAAIAIDPLREVLNEDHEVSSFNCASKKFHFFHGPSHSVVEVQVKDSSVASKLELSKSMLPQEVSHIVKEEVVLMDGLSETLSPSDLEGASSSVSDGVRVCVMNIGTGVRNLRSKRNTAIRRTATKVNDHPDDVNPRKRRGRNKANFKDNPTSVHLHGTRERKKIGRVKDGGRQDKAMENPTRRKHKRDRVIEDSYSDPHIFRSASLSAVHCIDLLLLVLWSLFMGSCLVW